MPMNKNDLLDALAHDPSYGCYSRQGLELVAWPRIAKSARWIIFADIDGMHELNAAHGYTDVDRRIRQALKVRSTDIVATGRWFSGDELVWVISNGDPEGMVKRMVAGLAKQGLTATFAVVPVISRKLSVNVRNALDLVQQAKRDRQK